AVVASAGAASRPATPQRTRMKACNADARTRDLHGDPRRAFMKQCLSGKARPADLF
ncbi:MAG TPA: PsiF family protein, partial [Burkholderiaceae bacterium]